MGNIQQHIVPTNASPIYERICADLVEVDNDTHGRVNRDIDLILANHHTNVTPNMSPVQRGMTALLLQSQYNYVTITSTIPWGVVTREYDLLHLSRVDVLKPQPTSHLSNLARELDRIQFLNRKVRTIIQSYLIDPIATVVMTVNGLPYRWPIYYFPFNGFPSALIPMIGLPYDQIVLDVEIPQNQQDQLSPMDIKLTCVQIMADAALIYELEESYVVPAFREGGFVQIAKHLDCLCVSPHAPIAIRIIPNTA